MKYKKTELRFTCALLTILAAMVLMVGTARAQTTYFNHLNLNFGSGTNTGAAAFTGGLTNQPWNTIPAATTVASNYTLYGTSTQVPVITYDTFTNLLYATGSNSPVTVTLTNLLSVGHNYAENTMFDSFLYANAMLVEYDWNEDLMDYVSIPADPSITINHLSAGTYNLYLYGVGGSYYEGEGFRVKVGTNAASSWKYTSPPDPIDTNWTENVHYVLFTNLVVGTNETVFIELLEGYYTDVVNGLQIMDLTSTNGPNPQLPSVAFDPASGATVPVNVSLSVSGHGDATIYYTTDGSTPTTSSSVYSSTISVTTESTLKAFATKASYPDSPVSSASYILPTAPAPTMDVASGNYHNTITVTISSTLSGASYKYSYNGSTWTDYTSPLSIDGGATLYAKTVKSGYYDSSTTTRTYTFSIGSTTISPSYGVFTNATTMTLSSGTTGATLQYSTNHGTSWNNYTGAVALDGVNDGTGFVMVTATKAGYTGSSGTSGLFTFMVASPVFSHASGNYTNSITATLSCATTNATIEYSFDQIAWNEYSTGLSLTNSVSLYARASKAGYLNGGHSRFSASEGFSEIHGLNQWFYLYSTNQMGFPDSFLPFYDSTLDVWRKTNEVMCLVGPLHQSPGATSDSVRTFLVPLDGEVSLTGQAELSLPEDTVDGVEFRVLVNSATAQDWVTLDGSTPLTQMNVTTNVTASQNIHFQLTAGSDTDGDLLEWSPTVTYNNYRTYTINDSDGDGLNNDLENAIGTDPNDEDSDNDGVSDYIEWLQGRNPLVAGSVADTGGVVKLVTFTPLK